MQGKGRDVEGGLINSAEISPHECVLMELKINFVGG